MNRQQRRNNRARKLIKAIELRRYYSRILIPGYWIIDLDVRGNRLTQKMFNDATELLLKQSKLNK